MGYYTRDFRSGNVEAAVDYLTLICLNGDLPGALGKAQADLCHEALRELVLETREFAQLLGDIRSDGTRVKGLVEERLKLLGLANQEDFLRTVTIQAASVANTNGRTTDAVLLYHLAEDYDNVIEIINGALSEAIAVEIGDEEMRLQPLKPRKPSPAASNSQQQQQQQKQPPASANSSLSLTSVEDPAALARNMISLYNSNAMYYQKIRPANRDACGILLRLSEVRAKVSAGLWAEALDVSPDTLSPFPFPHTSSPLLFPFLSLPPSPPQNQQPNLPPPSFLPSLILKYLFVSDDRHPHRPPPARQILHPHHPLLRNILQRPPANHLAQPGPLAPLDHHLHRPPARYPRHATIRRRHPPPNERRLVDRCQGSYGFCGFGQVSSWRARLGGDY